MYMFQFLESICEITRVEDVKDYRITLFLKEKN